MLSTFLNELDGIATTSPSTGARDGSSAIFVLAACADISSLDKALCRPGRLSHNIHLGKPSDDDVLAILTHYMSAMPVAEQLTAEMIVHIEGFPRDPTPADLSAICREALQVALKESIVITSQDTRKPVVAGIAKRHFVSALEAMFPDNYRKKSNAFTFPTEEFKFEGSTGFSHGSTF